MQQLNQQKTQQPAVVSKDKLADLLRLGEEGPLDQANNQTSKHDANQLNMRRIN